MRTDYPDGSFMLEWQSARAWYYPIGIMYKAEYKRKNGKTVAVSHKHTKVIEWLTKQGHTEVELLARGILKRKV